MQDLPQELVGAIVSLLKGQRSCDTSTQLAPLASINHNWKAAVERELWNHITIEASAGIVGEDIRIFQQYIEGPSRRSRRSMIKVLSLSWHYGNSSEDSKTTEGVSEVPADPTAASPDDPWDFPELVGCEDEEDLETNAESRPEPDWDKVNAMISDSESDDEPGEHQGGHRSESDTDNDDPGSEDPQESSGLRDCLLQQQQQKQTLLFDFLTDLWSHLASCDGSLKLKRINLRLEGKKFDNKIYASLRHDEERIVDLLQSTLDFDLKLPSLPYLEEIFVDGRRALAFWPALVAAKIATASNSAVPIMEYRAQAFGKRWEANAVAGLELQLEKLRDTSATKFVELPCRTMTRYAESDTVDEDV
ncbi:hypothetical protein OPT61_g3801 [Boeremia exigua]|uniref:Uncharacterized protein n=1 Tax=Boeremia exigua TaxID=749465 RepID=A0ACC2IGL1_9PLEO|nr:hypothetical protein OPT61_g3801 [Boeremia exigua]